VDATSEALPQLNERVVTFAKNNLGKQVGDGECWTLVGAALTSAGARIPTPIETNARVSGRRLETYEKRLPGDIVEFSNVRLGMKDKSDSIRIPFHTTILLLVKNGKYVLLHQHAAQPVAVWDLSQFELTEGELIVYRPVPPGTKLPEIILPAPEGTWLEPPSSCENIRYLSDMAEFDVRVTEKRFGKKGDLGGFWAGGSSRIRVNKKESPNGLSMCPDSNTYSGAKYRLDKSAATFSARVALNDSAGAPGWPPGDGRIPSAVTFQVLGDDKELWKSQSVDTARIVQNCSVDVVGVDILELRVDCPGSAVNAHAVWLEPRILLR
jgi:NPCBM/NEW2 domain